MASVSTHAALFCRHGRIERVEKLAQHRDSFLKHGPVLSNDCQQAEQGPAIEDDSVYANLARMQSPLFKRVARALEQSVPETKGFGQFRDSDK